MAEYCKVVLSGIELYGRQITVQDSRVDIEQGVFSHKVLRVMFTKPANYTGESSSVALEKEEREEDMDKLYAKLKTVLGTFGKVDGQVFHDGYALYSFADPGSAQKAADALNSQFICGLLLTTTVITR